MRLDLYVTWGHKMWDRGCTIDKEHAAKPHRHNSSRAASYSLSSMTSSHASQQSLRHDSNISVDTVWISIDSQNILWLPSEYRPSCLTASDKVIGVGTGHGKVWIGRVK